MAMPQRDEKIEAIKRLDACRRLRADLQRLRSAKRPVVGPYLRVRRTALRPLGRASRGFPPKQASSVHLAESSLRCASVHSRSAELSVLRGDDSLSTARDGVFFICGAAAVSMTEPEGSLARSKVLCWSWGRPKFATPKIVKGAPQTLRLREAQMESLSFGFD